MGETFAGLPFEKGVDLTDALKENLPDGISLAQMALRWILDHDAVSVIIPGASSPQQVRSNAAAADLDPLPTSYHQAVSDFYTQTVHHHIRGPY